MPVPRQDCNASGRLQQLAHRGLQPGDSWPRPWRDLGANAQQNETVLLSLVPHRPTALHRFSMGTASIKRRYQFQFARQPLAEVKPRPAPRCTGSAWISDVKRHIRICNVRSRHILVMPCVS